MDYQSLVLKIWSPLQPVVVAVLAVLIGVWSAQVTWSILSPPEPINAPVISPTSATSGGEGVNWLQVGRDVAQRELFGEVVVVQNEPQPEQIEAPETTLNLTLQAVMAQGSGEGFAVIGQGSGAGKVFGVGEDIFGSATLESVFGDRIILDRNGRRETLRYEKLETGRILEAVTVEQDRPDSLQEALAQANQEVSNGGDLQAQVQGMVNYVAQRANEDPEAFLNEVGLQPTEGGYQVTRRARQLQMVGLRPGDVVTAVNDSPVGNVQSDQMLLNQVLQTGGELKIEIRRGSRSFTIYQTIPTF